MNRRRRGLEYRLAALTALAFVLGIVVAQSAGAADPQVTIDRAEVAPGEPVIVTFQGFDSSFVNIVLCGNLGYRGAADCNVTAGVSKETLAGGRPKLVQLIAHPPPTHCPCIVRAMASSGDAFAVAPVVITGHPVAEVVGVPDGPLVEVEVETVEANEGVWATLRAALGGPTRYRSTVTVRNTTTAPLTKVALSGAVGHWLDDDAVLLDLEPPGELEPGASFAQQVVTDVPAPSVGDFRFEVVASGAGSTVAGAVTARNRPVLLYFLIALLIGDLAMIGSRATLRRRARREVSPGKEPLIESSAEPWGDVLDGDRTDGAQPLAV